MIAGRKDALSLTALAASIAAATPWLAPTFTPTMAAGIAAVGAAGFTWERMKERLSNKDLLSREDFVIPSDVPPPNCMGKEGIRMGITTDENLPVDLGNSLLSRHTAIIGQSGVGKTTLGEYILWQQTVRGGGWLFIDAKIDRDTRDHMAYMARVTGREDELYVLDISSPENSNTMNPILHGDPDEVASRLLNLIPSSENNPGSDFYRQGANHALTVIIAALQASKRLYHFGDLSILMQSAKALEELERMTPTGPERRALSIFLDQYRANNRDKGTHIQLDKLKQVLGGMAGRISLFAQGKFGQVFNVYNPEIVLHDLILQNKMLYISLPTMAKDTAALNLGKIIVSDLRSAVASIQDLPASKRPKVPFIALLDEMGSYAMQGIARLFEQARSAGIALLPAFQSFSQLNQVSPDFADVVIQNTWNKIFFKFGSNDSTETAVELLGSIKRFAKSVSVSANQGASVQTLRTTPESGVNDGGGMSVSWREEEDFRVTPDQLRALGMGQAFCITGAKVYHLKTPMINFPKDTGSFRITRHKIELPDGFEPLHYEERLNEFLLSA